MKLCAALPGKLLLRGSRRDGNFKTKFCRMEKVSSSAGVSLVGGALGKFVESLVGEGRGAEEAGEMVQQCTHVIGATSIIIAT